MVNFLAVEIALVIGFVLPLVISLSLYVWDKFHPGDEDA